MGLNTMAGTISYSRVAEDGLMKVSRQFGEKEKGGDKLTEEEYLKLCEEGVRDRLGVTELVTEEMVGRELEDMAGRNRLREMFPEGAMVYYLVLPCNYDGSSLEDGDMEMGQYFVRMVRGDKVGVDRDMEDRFLDVIPDSVKGACGFVVPKYDDLSKALPIKDYSQDDFDRLKTLVMKALGGARQWFGKKNNVVVSA